MGIMSLSLLQMVQEGRTFGRSIYGHSVASSTLLQTTATVCHVWAWNVVMIGRPSHLKCQPRAILWLFL